MKKLPFIKNIVAFVLTALLFLGVSKVMGQGTLDSPNFKNNVKINISSWILYNNVFVLSYERNVSKYQTFSITGGYVELPMLTPFGSPTKFQRNISKSGFTIGGDYRFYLRSENKYGAPHGVYIGPYISYYNFKNNRYFQYTDSAGGVSNGNLNTRINVGNLGVQFGYQFIIKKRMSIDLILFAPSFSRYSLHMDVGGGLSDQAKEEIYNDVTKALIDRIPLLNKLVTEKHVDASGTRSAFAPGLRYCVYIGYSFGKR